MSAPEEIVCETESAFISAVYANVAWVPTGRSAPGDSMTFGGKRIVYRPPPPRDAAREAFEAWWKREVSGTDVPAMCWSPLGLGHYTSKALDRGYRAFLAGRASVKGSS